MLHNLWTRKNIALVAAIVSLGCVAAVLAIGLASPSGTGFRCGAWPELGMQPDRVRLDDLHQGAAHGVGVGSQG